MIQKIVKVIAIVCLLLPILYFIFIGFFFGFRMIKGSINEKREYAETLEYEQELNQYIKENKESFTRVFNYEIEEYKMDNTNNEISAHGEFQEDRNIISQKFELYYFTVSDSQDNNEICVYYTRACGDYYEISLVFYNPYLQSLTPSEDCIVEDDYSISVDRRNLN